MSRAEEIALEKYPAHSVLIVPARGGGYYADKHLRDGYIEGYSQAERDLELSWEDIEEIYLLVIEIDNAYMEANAQNDYQYDVKEMYQEVLKRFKERKETKD